MKAIDAKINAEKRNERAGIQLGRGYRFGSGGEKYLRMNVGTSRILIKEALDRIKMAADKI